MPDSNTVHVDLKSLIRLRAQARGFSFLPRQPVKSLLSGRHASKIRGRGLDFEELRHYRVGDDIRTIDWKVTNRTGKPHVRVYTEERERPVLLLVDQRSSMFFGSVVKMKSVVAAELAALAAWRVLDSSDRLGGIVFNDTEISSARPERSQRNVMRLLGQVANFNNQLNREKASESSPEALDKALAKAEQLCSHDFLLIVISDFSGWNPTCLNRLKRISRHNDIIAALVYDPLEKELPVSKSFVVSEGGQQIEVSPARDKLAERFSKSFENSVDEIRTELRKRGVPVIPIQTVDSASDQIRQSIGQIERSR